MKQKPDSVFGTYSFISDQNQALKNTYDRAIAEGFKEIYYLDNQDLIGSDREGTVDGTHFSDLGHYRMAVAVREKLEKIIYN